jgi:hypothetical protein
MKWSGLTVNPRKPIINICPIFQSSSSLAGWGVGERVGVAAASGVDIRSGSEAAAVALGGVEVGAATSGCRAQPTAKADKARLLPARCRNLRRLERDG